MKRKYIFAGRLIDGSGTPVQKNVCLVIENGRIADILAVQPEGSLPDAERIDLRHCTLLPPLVDGSVSLCTSAATAAAGAEETGKEYDEAEKRITRHLHYCFSHGVLVAADGTDERGFIRRFRAAQEGAQLPSIVCGTRLNGYAGGRAVEADISANDFIRVACSADMSRSLEGDTSPVSADIKALLQRTKKVKKVMVANGEEAVALALEAGGDAIEQGIFLGTENLLKMADRGVAWMPSLLKLRTLGESAPPPSASLYKKALLHQLDMLRRARQAGVKVITGTAAGFPGIIHGESLREELKLLLAAGYPLVEAVRCASINGAEFFQAEAVGVLQKGGPATFLVTRGTVQQLPRKLGYLEDIYIAGSSSDMYRKNPVKTVYPSPRC